jgi:poly(A) polymerase
MQRFHEDPVRLLRAIRFLAKLNISITEETEEPLTRLSYLLGHVSSGRLYQEVLKFFEEGASAATLNLLLKYKLFAVLFPETGKYIEKPATVKLLQLALKNTDARIIENKTISPAFLFAVFLWHPMQHEITTLQSTRLPIYVAYEKALQLHVKKQTEILAIPRVMQMTIRDICLLQYRLLQRRGSQPFRLLQHPRFRAGYDLLLLRAEAEADIETTKLASWWTRFIEADVHEREKLLKEVDKPKTPRKRKTRKR